MTETTDAAGVNGLKFFSQMSASISHELKNSLSIINESAGLLEDLSIMAETGKPLDNKRVQQLSASVKRQVKRTGGIIKNMNRFSHLTDDPIKQIEVTDFLRFIIDISRRLTETAGVNVVLSEHEKPLSIVTRPFYLHYLLWRLIQLSIKSAGVTRELTLSPRPDDNGICIVFENHKRFDKISNPPAHGECLQTLLSLLAAKMHINDQERETKVIMTLFVPEAIDLSISAK